MKRRSKKGFTLAELLIVMAIIAILVAIMFPVFGAQLDKARATAELANVRARYSELVAEKMLGDATTETIDITNGASNPIMIMGTDLAEALTYDETEMTLEKGNNAKGKITVKYNNYSGSFETDEDVKFDSLGTYTKAGKKQTTP